MEGGGNNSWDSLIMHAGNYVLWTNLMQRILVCLIVTTKDMKVLHMTIQMINVPAMWGIR